MASALGPITIGLIVTGGVGILGSIFTPGPDKALNRLLIWTAVICLYGMWLMVYNSQVNPIQVPLDTRYSSATSAVGQEMANHWNANNGPRNG